MTLVGLAPFKFWFIRETYDLLFWLFRSVYKYCTSQNGRSRQATASFMGEDLYLKLQTFLKKHLKSILMV